MAIVNRVPFNRRTRFILTASLAVGYGATMVPTWFSYVFTYDGDNHALRGFYDAIALVMETGFAVTALIAMILNLALPEEIEDTHPEDEAKALEAERESVANSSAEEEPKIQVPVSTKNEV